jgi:hypothetical protein
MDASKFDNFELDEKEKEILDAMNEGRLEIQPPSKSLLLAARDNNAKRRNLPE